MYQSCQKYNIRSYIVTERYFYTWTIALAFALIIKHIPLNAESFSSLSRIFRSEVHQGLINWPKHGATSRLQWSPRRPSVIPVFSNSVFGVETRRDISISGGRTVWNIFSIQKSINRMLQTSSPHHKPSYLKRYMNTFLNVQKKIFKFNIIPSKRVSDVLTKGYFKLW